jgi:hypothetical protein
MRFRWQAPLYAASAMVMLAGVALAQNPAQPGANPREGQSLYDPGQLPAQRGRVRQFTLTPRGDIDGLILMDGTEVKTPPHLSTQIAYAIKPGDEVTIHGLHAAALPLLQALSLTDDATGRTVIDNGPPGPGPAPPPPPLVAGSPGGPISAATEVQGRVRMVLHGPQGDANGALLEDGTILRLPPPEAHRFASLLQPGATLVAKGTELVTPMGKVLDAQRLGPSREQLSLIEALPGPRAPPPPPGPPRP